MDKFNGIDTFQKVVEAGSYAAAAKSLGVSPSTVSKAISRLEDRLNIVLIHRDSRKLKLTEAGQVYFEQGRGILESLGALEQQLHDRLQNNTGKLKINLPVSYGRLYILPMLESFRKQHPGIQLEISLSDHYVDLVSEGFDLGIRSGTLEDSSLIAQQLSPVDFLICAEPGFWKTHNKNHGIDNTKTTAEHIDENDFGAYPWLRFKYQQSGRPLDIMTSSGHHNPGADIFVDDGEALAEMCAKGLGICQLPHFIANDYLRSERLICVAPFLSSTKAWRLACVPKTQTSS